MILLVRLALRHLRGQPAAALVTVLGLAVGVAGLRAMELGSAGALATMRATFVEAAGPAAWVVVPGGDARAALPPGSLGRVEGVEGVVDALPLVQARSVRLEEVRLWMGVVLPEGDAGLLVLGVDPAEAGRRWTPVSGGAPVLLDGEALVNDAWARARGLAVGDALRLWANGRAVEWRIAGTVARSGLGGRGWGRVVIAPIGTVRAAFGLAEDEVHEVAVVLDPAVDESRVGEALRAALGPGPAVIRPGERGGEVEQKLANLRAGTDLLSGVTLFLAAFLIAGQFSARAAERARLLGLLRAIGATRAQAAGTLLVEGALLAIPGAALGVALGRPLADVVAFALGQAAQADLRVGGGDPAGAGRAAIAGVVVALLAVAIPAARAARGEPLEAIRARGHAAEPPPRWLAGVALLIMLATAASFVAWPAGETPRAVTLIRVLAGLGAAAAILPAIVVPLVRSGVGRRLGAPGALGVASLRWRPVRSGLAAGAVLICVALVGGVGALGKGMRAEMERWSERALGWDWYVSRPDGFTDAEVDAVRALPEVEVAAGVSIRPVRARLGERDVDLSFVALDPPSYARADLLTLATPDASAVASLADGRGVLVTTVVAEQFGVAIGDALTVPGPDGPVRLEVRGLVIDYTQNGFAILGSQGLLRATQGATRSDIVAVRGSDGSALAALPGVVIESRAELRGRVLRLVDRSMGALDVLLWLSGVVGVLAVGAALAQGAVERRADVAVLRAVGMERAQVRRMLVTEGVATALIGVIGGVPLGIALGKVFADATGTLGIPIPFVPAWGALFGASTAALVAAAAAAWLPARRAAAIEPAEALRE